MAHVMRFPIERRMNTNVAQVTPATVTNIADHPPSKPYGPIIDLLTGDADTDGTALPCDTEAGWPPKDML